jgi:sugar/nucleoside kinase (ribokinase family)
MMDSLTGDDLHRLSGRLLDMGGKVVGIKCGFRGVYVRTCDQGRLEQMGRVKPADTAAWANRELWHPSFVVEYYAGGTGAGDSTIAGFLSAFLRGHSLEESLRYACANGAFNVTAPDALGGLRPWEEVVHRVEEGWRKNPLTVQGNGWERRADGTWRGPAERV